MWVKIRKRSKECFKWIGHRHEGKYGQNREEKKLFKYLRKLSKPE